MQNLPLLADPAQMLFAAGAVFARMLDRKPVDRAADRAQLNPPF
jgi:hypothetical protein